MMTRFAALAFAAATLLSLIVVVADKNPAAYSKKLLVFDKGRALLLPANHRPDCFTIDFVAEATMSKEENRTRRGLNKRHPAYVRKIDDLFVLAHYERFEALRTTMELGGEQQASQETSASDDSERRRKRFVSIGTTTTAAKFTVTTKDSLSKVNQTFARLERTATSIEQLQFGMGDAMVLHHLSEFRNTLERNTRQMVDEVRDFLRSKVFDSPLVNRKSVVTAIRRHRPSIPVSLPDYAYDSATIEFEPTTFPALRVDVCIPQQLMEERVGHVQSIFHVGSFLDHPVHPDIRILSFLLTPHLFVALPNRRVSVDKDENCRKGARGLWVCTESEANETCNIDTFQGCLMQNQFLTRGSFNARCPKGVAVIAAPFPVMAEKHCGSEAAFTQLQISDTFVIDLHANCSLIVDGKSIQSCHGATLNYSIENENEFLNIGTSTIKKIINSIDQNKPARICVDGANIVDVLTDASSPSWWDRFWEDLDIKIVAVAGVALLIVIAFIIFLIVKAVQYVRPWLAQFATPLHPIRHWFRGKMYSQTQSYEMGVVKHRAGRSRHNQEVEESNQEREEPNHEIEEPNPEIEEQNQDEIGGNPE